MSVECLCNETYDRCRRINSIHIVAIGTDIFLAQDATIGEPLFWASLVFSLTLGLVAAYPVNVLLIHRGVKEGMADPTERDTAHAAA